MGVLETGFLAGVTIKLILMGGIGIAACAFMTFVLDYEFKFNKKKGGEKNDAEDNTDLLKRVRQQG